MNTGFPELVIGGVLVAPFVAYAALAGLIVAILRPLLRVARFEHVFLDPPLTLLGLYVIVLAVLIALF